MTSARDARQLGGVRPVDDLRLLVEHLDDLVHGRDRGQERVVELRELLDRVEEVREVEREGEQRADRHVSLQHEPAAVAEHDRRRDGREEVDGREVEPVQDDRLVVRLAVALVDAAEAALVLGLAGERLHDPHAGDVLGQRRRDEAEALAHAPVRAVRADAEPGGRDRHQRQHHQRREREPPVEQEEDDRGAGEQQRVLDEARDAVGDELVERLHVVRDAADDHAGAVALVVAERQPLQVAEEPVAQVGEHALPDPAGEVGLHTGQGERQHARDEEQGDDPGQRLQVAVVDAAVDGELGEVRRRERDERVREQRGDRERCPALVRQRQPDEHREPPAGLAPRPVVHLRAALIEKVRAGLPDLHAVASSPPSSPCSCSSR